MKIKNIMTTITLLLTIVTGVFILSCSEDPEITNPFHPDYDRTPLKVSISGIEPEYERGAEVSIGIDIVAIDEQAELAKVSFYADNELLETISKAPFTTIWSTTALTSGTHALKIIAEDIYGYTAENSQNVELTPNPLGVELTASENLTEFYKGAVVELTASISKGAYNTINNVKFYQGETLLATVENEPYSFSWASREEATGKHSFKAVVTDNYETTAETIKEINLIANPLNLEITSPAVNADYPQASVVTLTAEPELGTYNSVENVKFYVDGALVNTDSSAPYSYEWLSGETETGTHTVKAVVLDNFGSTAESSRDFNLTANALTVNVTSPANGSSYEQGSSFTLSAETTTGSNNSVENVKFYVDGVLVNTDSSAPYSYEWSSGEAETGTHTVKAVVLDNFGSTAESSRDFNLIANPLNLEITSPAVNADYPQASVVTLTAEPELGTYNSVENVKFYVDGALVNTDSSAPYSYEWLSGETETGSHVVRAVVLDNFGSTAESSRDFNISANTLTVHVTSPAAGSSYEQHSTITLSAEATTGSYNSVESVKFYVDDELVNTDTASPYSYEWLSGETETGTHTVKAVVLDNFGSTVEQSVGFYITANSLAVNVTSPAAGSSYEQGSSITLSAETTTGSYNSVESVKFYVDDELVNTDTASPYSYEWLSGETAIGSHTVKAVVLDNFGSTAEESVDFNLTVEYGAMVSVTGGTFTMGDHFSEGDSDELPTHSVTVSSFYIGKYELTHTEFITFLNSRGVSSNGSYNGNEVIDMDASSCAIGHNGSFYFKGSSYAGSEDCPVIEVTWYGATEYCNWLSEQEGYTPCYTISSGSVSCDFNKNGYRLPTEAEWEYAARGGVHHTDNLRYSGCHEESDLTNYAWYSSNSGSQSHEVGGKLANQLGIFDLSGNVWEWCNDWYGGYSSTSQTNPVGPASGSYRV